MYNISPRGLIESENFKFEEFEKRVLKESVLNINKFISEMNGHKHEFEHGHGQRPDTRVRSSLVHYILR